MGLFDFGKPKAKTSSTPDSCKLDKNVETVLRDLKKARAEYCHSLGHSVSKMGQDLAHIEKKTREFYTIAVQELKGGSSHSQTYEKLLNTHANSDADREIINRMFMIK